MLKNLLLATAMALSVYVMSSNAEAGHRPLEWYVGIEGGANLIDDAQVTVSPGSTKIEAGFDTGWSVFIDAGYRWEDHWRLELEAGWRQNDVDCVAVGTGPCAGGNWGDISQLTGMVNFIHDIELDETTTLSIGMGLGANYVQANSPLLGDEDLVFAGQALLELTHQLTDRIDVVLTYRFMASDDPQFQRTASQSVAFNNENQTLSLGLRFDLEGDEDPQLVSTPACPPAPPEAGPQQFVVFFGFNKASLDAAAQSVVTEAAATAMHDGFASITVTGYTDTAGSPAYNDRLSARRADAVKRSLVSKGIAEKAIKAIGKGETVLMVQTSDQEKEARNRRATIDLAGANSAAQPTAPRASEAKPSTEVKPATAATVPTPSAKPKRVSVNEETLAQYHVWIAQARAAHHYADPEQRMFDVMMCESGGNAATVNPAGPNSGLFQYSTQTWQGAWNDWRNDNILDAKAQIFATAQAWQKGMQRQWGCYTHPH